MSVKRIAAFVVFTLLYAFNLTDVDARPLRGAAPNLGAIGNANLNINEVYPANYVNILKTFGQSVQTPTDILKLDADGYPTSQPGNAIFMSSPQAGTFFPNVNYTCSSTARFTPILFLSPTFANCNVTQGTVAIAGCPTSGASSGNVSFTPTVGPWKITFDVGTSFGAVYTSNTGSGNYGGSGEVACYRTSDAARYAAGKTFTSEFITRVKNATPNPIRFMPLTNTGNSNVSNQTAWAYRKKPSNLSFTSNQTPPGAIVGGGSAAISGTNNVYTSAATTDNPSGAYVDGEVAIGITNVANTATNFSGTISGSTLTVAAPTNFQAPGSAIVAGVTIGGSGVATGVTVVSQSSSAVSTTGTFTSSSNTITVASTSNLLPGMLVIVAGVTGGTTITSINTNTSVITISINTTAPGTGVTISFNGGNGVYTISSPYSQTIPAESMTAAFPMTFNPGGRGAKPIVGVGGGQLVNGLIGANAVGTFVYKAAPTDAWIYAGGGIQWALPLEAQIELAKEVNADAWFTIPYLANSDFITNLGTIVRDNLPSQLNAYFEFSNEVWNFAFPQTGYAFVTGNKLGWVQGSAQNIYSWYGLQSKQSFDLLTTVFSGQPSRLRPVLAYQIAAGTSNLADRYGGAQLIPNKTTQQTVTFTTGTPCKVLWTFNGFATEGAQVSFSSTGTLPTDSSTGNPLSGTYFVTNNVNNNDGSTPLNIEHSPGSGAIACSGSPTGTATGTYTNTLYGSIVGATYNAKPTRPVDTVKVSAGAPYAGGENLCRGPDINCSYNSTNAAPLQAIINAVEAGNTSLVVSLVDQDIQIGRSAVQNVTASGTTFTTSLAHGFTAGSTDVMFQVSGGTSYSGVPVNTLYRITSTPTSTTFTMQGYVAGSPSGANVNAGTAGSGTVTVGRNQNRNLAQLANTWIVTTQAVAALYNGDRPSSGPYTQNLVNIQYEGNLEPKGPSAAECLSLGLTTVPPDGTGALCSAEIASAIVTWKNDVASNATQQLYFNQFMGRDANMIATFGLMLNAKAPAQLTLSCSVDYALVNGCLPNSPVFETYNGFGTFSLQNFLLKRDINPASNDNDPMWLEKAA
jgi:hypothetical protein